jgi:hypothetical protein
LQKGRRSKEPRRVGNGSEGDNKRGGSGRGVVAMGGKSRVDTR